MQLASRFGKQKQVLISDVPIDDYAIKQVAPSIFAEEPHSSRSDRYSYIPTISVLRRLRQEGFEPFMVAQTKTRTEDRMEHTKHMLRLRHSDSIANAHALEIILLNSHDGTSSYQLMGGVFRFVCMNGMVCGEMFEDVRVRHSGNVANEVVDAAFKIVGNFDKMESGISEMKSLPLSKDEQTVFAESALELKYEEGTSPITAEDVLAPRRGVDSDNDLWTVFNRIQENMVRGGLHGVAPNGRRRTTRSVTGVDSNIKLNRALWSLAEGMKKLKQAA